MTEPRVFPSDDEILQDLLRRLDERVCVAGEVFERFFAGALSPAESADLQAHLADCLSCLSTFSRLQSLHEASEPRPRLVGDSPAAQTLRSELTRLAAMDTGRRAAPPLLLVGEAGTGKGVVARAIHDLSRRASRAFVDVQCVAVPWSAVDAARLGSESEASRDMVVMPRLLSAKGGTLFLDGIEALPLSAQDALLAALAAKALHRADRVPAGASDVRVIAATNVDLQAAARRGTFRADLFHLLASSTLLLPPLRERRDDIVPLARYFARLLSAQHGIVVRLSAEAEQCLLGYRWPGNVRELANVIARAALRRRGSDEIGAEELELPRA